MRAQEGGTEVGGPFPFDPGVEAEFTIAHAYVSYFNKLIQVSGWSDGSGVKSAYCSCRGPELSSLDPCKSEIVAMCDSWNAGLSVKRP